VYRFGKGGAGLAGRKDEFVKGCFKDLPNPKDGYDIEDCKDQRHRRLLAFLAPIVYPDKPNQITVTLGKHHLWSIDWREEGELGEDHHQSSHLVGCKSR
jgi:hypothetical protein